MQKHRVVYKVCVLIIAVTMWTALDPSQVACQPVGPDHQTDHQADNQRDGSDDAAASLNFPTYLYFADTKNEFLVGEQRSLPAYDDPVTHCRLIIEELIKGPGGSDLIKTIPGGTNLRAVYITSDKTAYVDLTKEITSGHIGGVRSELMTVYSIVNTLVLNVSEVEQVNLLIEGQEAETLSGHIDIRVPLKADMLLIR
jgi:spore germination protein GerM